MQPNDPVTSSERCGKPSKEAPASADVPLAPPARPGAPPRRVYIPGEEEDKRPVIPLPEYGHIGVGGNVPLITAASAEPAPGVVGAWSLASPALLTQREDAPPLRALPLSLAAAVEAVGGRAPAPLDPSPPTHAPAAPWPVESRPPPTSQPGVSEIKHFTPSHTLRN